MNRSVLGGFAAVALMAAALVAGASLVVRWSEEDVLDRLAAEHGADGPPLTATADRVAARREPLGSCVLAKGTTYAFDGRDRSGASLPARVRNAAPSAATPPCGDGDEVRVDAGDALADGLHMP